MSTQFAEFEGKCKKTIEHFKKELSRVRTGRASSTILDGLHVEYYGSPVPLLQVASISVPEPRVIAIQPYDSSAAEGIEKAIMQSDLGLNPSRDGSIIRIILPALTEERRKEIVKKLHKMAEEERIALRNLRREANDELKKREKDKAISVDESKKGQEEVQKITDKYVKDIDVVLAGKEKEVLDV